MNIIQALSDVKINSFGAVLLGESFLKSQLAQMCFDKGEPLKFFLPIQRGDTPGWVGVDITIQAVDKFDEPHPTTEPASANPAVEPASTQGEMK